MVPTRRAILRGLGAAGLAAAGSRALPSAWAASDAPIPLRARPGTAQLLEPPGGPTAIWGYDGRVPGPELRVRRGEELWVRFENGLPQPSTVHWHGIRIDNAMDGVAHLTQHAVEPGGAFDYRFRLPDAGTYWYHPHHRAAEQLARGLYGALIVEEHEPPDVDRDLTLIVDDWRLEESGAIHEASLDSLHDRAHAGRLGNVLTIDGAPFAEVPVRSGERLRLRLLNACNARILDLRFEDVACHLVALDGQPVPPAALADGRVELAPSQRADLVVDMIGRPGDRAAIAEVTSERLVAGQFVYDRVATVPGRRAPPAPLPDNGLPEPDLAQALAVDLVMTGGAMGRLAGAVHMGRHVAMPELARQHGQAWAMNGTAGMPEAPLFSVPRGRTVSLRMVNDTRWPHAMHLHGHHFRRVGAGASDPSPWRDTALLERDETQSFAFVADNPGKWMIHCHMLEHQEGGMETWFEVA